MAIAVVAHLPAPVMPVAAAVDERNRMSTVGDREMEFCPHRACGKAPVEISLRAPLTPLANVEIRFMRFVALLILLACKLVLRLFVVLCKTPKSRPVVAAEILTFAFSMSCLATRGAKSLSEDSTRLLTLIRSCKNLRLDAKELPAVTSVFRTCLNRPSVVSDTSSTKVRESRGDVVSVRIDS